MDNSNLFNLISTRLQAMGYVVRQSPSSPNCWYASKSEFEYLFALVRENDQWRVNDISGRGTLEQPRIERELNDSCN
ncbi:hypothetical protein [Leptolyngbya sp. 7M]|uniref:hypothetical protein n=1 Tax=Leptolyngbya sp. 7M TaxID=2812896 RepID=UPI001B8AE272|nr:hypothetical protein [Leptolyngbya sp. 7M]QYO63044.1 hypothetical protein JVX88_24110 [Leptolyngbya sp. 7M]